MVGRLTQGTGEGWGRVGRGDRGISGGVGVQGDVTRLVEEGVDEVKGNQGGEEGRGFSRLGREWGEYGG